MPIDLQSLEKIPRHVALIMDGNGRWAKERGLSRLEGHKEGAQSVRAVLRAAANAGVEFITVYAFSTENCLSNIAALVKSVSVCGGT